MRLWSTKIVRNYKIFPNLKNEFSVSNSHRYIFSKWLLLLIHRSLREKCPNTELFLVYFPVFGPNTGKYGPEITPYLDTFHAVVEAACKLFRINHT